MKLVFMAIREAAKKWTMPIHYWKLALNHFAVLYEGRITTALSVASVPSVLRVSLSQLLCEV